MKSEPIIFNYKPVDSKLSESIKKLPQVTLLINPESLSLNWKKIITRSRTKSRIVSFYWGQEPINFSYRGQTGNLYPSRELITYQQASIADKKEVIKANAEVEGDIDLQISQLEGSLATEGISESYREEATSELDTLISAKTGLGVETKVLSRLEQDQNLSHTEILELSPKYQKFKQLQLLYERSQNVNDLIKVQYRHYIFEGYFEGFTFTDDGRNPWNWIYNISFTVLKWTETFGTTSEEILLVDD